MKQAIQISFDEAGRILIPKSMRENLHLTPGMTLVVEPGEQGGVSLRVMRESPVIVEKDGMWVAKVKAVGNLANAVRHERDRRVFDLLQRAGL